MGKLQETWADRPLAYQAILIPANVSEPPHVVEVSNSGCPLTNLAEAIQIGASPTALLDWGK
eukprot:1530834-Pyramimonas_sp.AAC.1